MKSNWGNWIAFAYTAFVVLIIFMVYLTFGEKWDLVSEDYYEQEIKYQEKIDQKSRALEAEVKPQISIAGQNLVLSIPLSFESENNTIEGKANFFRPSDADKDFEFTIRSIKESIPLEKFSKGKYLAKIEWTYKGEKYYNEQTLIIP
jgi:hypothetical protein